MSSIFKHYDGTVDWGAVIVVGSLFSFAGLLIVGVTYSIMDCPNDYESLEQMTCNEFQHKILNDERFSSSPDQSQCYYYNAEDLTDLYHVKCGYAVSGVKG